MSEKMKENIVSERKKEHIELALRSQLSSWSNDKRFNYEPLLGKHPLEKDHKINFLGKKMRFPLWVSSMTGGTPEARIINRNLAKACNEFGLGMGLGSCRILLDDPSYLEEFDMRSFIGDEQPFFANLGIAQIEKSLKSNEIDKIEEMVALLKADGLIIHVNPLQEWLQPEGDRISTPSIDIIEQFIEQSDLSLIIKEVGQGMGPESLKRLMNLPVVIEFGAYGGTNFSQLEISRREEEISNLKDLVHIGHNYAEMLDSFNELLENKTPTHFKNIIVSGGMKGFLDGYYAVQKLNTDCIYGQASSLLNAARESYETLSTYIQEQIIGYNLASEFLTIRK